MAKNLYTINHLEKLLDNIPYEVWIKDIEGKYIYANEYSLKKVGLSKKEIIGKTDFDFRNKELAINCYLSDKEVLTNNKYIYNEEVVITEKGTQVFEVYKLPIILEDGECFLGGYAKEINNTKKFQKDFDNLFIKSSFEKENLRIFIKKVLNNIVSILFCKSADLFIYNNDEQTLKLYISSDKEIESIPININKNILNNVFDKFKICEVLTNTINDYYPNLSQYQSKTYLLEHENKILGLIFIRYNINNYPNDIFLEEICNKLSIIISKLELNTKIENDIEKNTLVDYLIINSRKNIDNYIDLEKLKINFLANISHEFKTPLNIILSSIQLLMKNLEFNESLNKDLILKYLNLSKQNSYRILRIINNVLDTTKVQNGFNELSLKNCNIINIIEDIVLSTVDYIKTNNRRIIFDTDVEELILGCDPDKIERVVLNLISNSLKFTNENGIINIHIKIENNKMFFHIKNDGPSISKEEGKKIFGNFMQTDESFTRKSEGSGIGLYLCKSFIEMHNGEIWANTDLKDGAEFIFYIPIKKVINSEKNIDLNSNSNSKIEKCIIEFSDIYL